MGNKNKRPVAGSRPPLAGNFENYGTPNNTLADWIGQPSGFVPEDAAHSWAKHFVLLNKGKWYGDCGTITCPACGPYHGKRRKLGVRDGDHGRIILVCLTGCCTYGEILQALNAQHIPAGWPYPFGQPGQDVADTMERVLAASKRGRHGH